MFSHWFKKKNEIPLAPILPAEIIVYGTSWCGDSRRCRNVLTSLGVSYQWIDIDKDKQGETYVREVNKGNRSIPTVVLPDGTVLVEPSDKDLTIALRNLISHS
jgi:mycoredoxin